MVLVSDLSNYFFITYLCVYVIFHVPFDIYMLIRKGKASYPTPKFRSTLEGLSVVLSSFIFWFYMILSPIIVFSSGKNIFVLEDIPEEIKLPITIVGIVIMSIGLIVGCLGRIGRGVYLARNEAKLATNWGHALVRHPSYFLYITGFIGIPFVAISPYLFILLLGIPGYMITSRLEEGVLIETFGDEYKDYQEKVGRFVFKIRKKK